MSSADSESKKTKLSWKATAILFIFLTIGASALAYYYYGQNQNNMKQSVLNSADRDHYYTQWQSDERNITTLNQQISSDNGQIASDKTTISADQSQIVSLQSQLYNPACQPNCDTTISQLNAKIGSLNSEVDSLNAQITVDNNQIAADLVLIQSLNNQISNLRDILGIRLSQTIASGVTKNLPRCGETGDPVCQGSSACTNPSTCTPQYIDPTDFLAFCSQSCYQGVLVVSWSSTVMMSLTFTSSYHSSSSISMSSASTSAGDFAFPIIANFTSTGALSTGGFHNDSCTKDNSGNYHCAAVSLTYYETFDY